MKPLVIGFGYRRRHGKDFAAQAIISEFGHVMDIRRYALADALRGEVSESIYGDSAAPHPLMRFLAGKGWSIRSGDLLGNPVKRRAILQFYGTDYRRAQDPVYWITKLDYKIRADLPMVALVTDLRFKNEVSWIRKLGGYTVNVRRFNADSSNYEEPDGGGDHVTEHDLDGVAFDYSLEAVSGDVKGLAAKAISVFRQIVMRDWATRWCDCGL